MTLPELLWQLVEVIPDGAMMRCGMTNPPYILEHLQDMAAILNHPRVYSFLHVPVQSASDAVLTDMKREYCQQDFRRVVDFLKQQYVQTVIQCDFVSHLRIHTTLMSQYHGIAGGSRNMWSTFCLRICSSIRLI